MTSNWPTREEFLERRHTPYSDRVFFDCSQNLLDYATPKEIKTLRHGLRERYRVLGREMRQMKAALGSQAKQRGEGPLRFWRRVLGEDRALALLHCRGQRHDINGMLRDIEQRGAPPAVPKLARSFAGTMHPERVMDQPPPLLLTIMHRYWAVYRAALVACWEEIDEKDWQADLKRRAKIEARVA